ncbi:MAG: MnhB domain-containing protein [Candidatus Binatia bacterium]
MTNEQSRGMSVIVKTVTRMTVWLILLYGIYIITHGHLSPGGGFAGGVIIALSFIHLILAYGKEAVVATMSENLIRMWESTGALAFLTIALLGLTGGYFFRNFLPVGIPFHLLSAGTIPLSNIAISLKVWAGLLAIFIALVLLRIDNGERESTHSVQGTEE